MKLVVYLLAVQVAVHLAAPYFTPYMLVHLELSYTQYMLLLGFGFLGKIIALPWVGSSRCGVRCPWRGWSGGRLLWRRFPTRLRSPR